MMKILLAVLSSSSDPVPQNETSHMFILFVCLVCGCLGLFISVYICVYLLIIGFCKFGVS